MMTCARLDRVRLIERGVLVAEIERLLSIIREYRRGWNDDADVHNERRSAVAGLVPAPDWLSRRPIWLTTGSRLRRSSAPDNASRSERGAPRERLQPAFSLPASAGFRNVSPTLGPVAPAKQELLVTL
jgi:hypothetical protein